MSEHITALARRAVACPRWRWMRGMRTTEGMRVIHDPALWPDRPCAIREGTWVDTAVPRPLGDHLPDLADPATLGCLLALVREAWEPYGTSVSTHRYDGGEWSIRTLPLPMFSTEAEALVAALEGAP
jgi:hypothetical protein